MTVSMITLIVLFSFFTLLMLGLPVAFCLIATSVVSIIAFWNPTALYAAATTIYTQSTKDIFLAIPLFVFLATVLEQSGIAESLFDMSYKWIGRLRGGLSVGSVFMCTIMDAISGLGASGIVTVGPIALPEMFKRQYDKRLATGCIAAEKGNDKGIETISNICMFYCKIHNNDNMDTESVRGFVYSNGNGSKV